MYKLLLCLRYLRTRWIALASIISVMLGVATMIVVNSVMAGFTHEMHKRLHGILSDITFESHSFLGFADPEAHMAEIRRVAGDDIQAMTAAVHVPAMLNFQYHGQWYTRQINLIGIDEETYSQVSSFGKYLLHPKNREQLRFILRQSGYSERLGEAGWDYRRAKVSFERERMRRWQAAAEGPQRIDPDEVTGKIDKPPRDFSADQLPELPPEPQRGAAKSPPSRPRSESAPEIIDPVTDPFAKHRPIREEDVFDPMKEQRPGIILGIAIASMKHRKPDGEVEELFLARPGDDIQVTLPTAGTPPQAISDTFTLVDFYESKMSEYDAGFAFVPLSYMQKVRGMIDPQTGQTSVTTIQIKLRPGAKLEDVRDRLRARFPPTKFPYRIQTWKDRQGPLLAAVQMETTILNILLFLIIAVAGFGILATFFMIVVEKTRDIGVLKSLGAPNRGVMSIFLTYGLSLGVLGSGVGLGLGLAFVIHINEIAAVLESITGREVFDPTVYYFQEIPAIIDPLTIAWIICGAMLIAVLASVLPAIRAARLHPVEALRYE